MAGIALYIKRIDFPDPISMGNKSYKLKYNIVEAKNQNTDTVLTFGGAFSNHIVATAAICKQNNLKCIGIIRGEEVRELNGSLRFAHEQGMKLHFISREEYRKKENKEFLDSLKEKFGTYYLVPEGGSNLLGVKGCTEILSKNDENFNFVCVACGTGTTLAGITLSLTKNQKAIGVAALKAKDYLIANVKKYISEERINQFEIIDKYHFGGYAKKTSILEDFVEQFSNESKIEIEPIYTGKLLFGIMNLIQSNYFKAGDQILAIHTGGLQYKKLK